MSRLLNYVYAILLAMPAWVMAQDTDTLRTVLLGEVFVHTDVLKSAEIGLSETAIDSLTLAQNNGASVADLLRNTAAGQIRSYGTNGPTAPSFRGTGAAHTAILWNGITLQSPLSGSQDLSLLPNGFANEVILQKGGTSSLYGSGAIGGTIQLNNKPSFNQGLTARTQQQLGSFGNHYQSYGINWSNRVFSNSTMFFARKMENDYPYLDRYAFPQIEKKRKNAAINQHGLLQQNDWHVNKYHLLGIKVWYQLNDFEIPNATVASDNAAAQQKDEFVRTMLNWSYDRDKFSVEYKQAFSWQDLIYQPSVGDTSQLTFQTWVNRMVLNWDLSKQNTLTLGVNQNYERASSGPFGNDAPTRNSTAFFASVRTKRWNDRLLAALNVREEIISNGANALTGSLGADYLLLDGLWLKGNLSRNYRLPTFNDLYWRLDGSEGNPKLEAESSLNYEFGFKYQLPIASENLEISTRSTYYNYLVDDWIQWEETGAGNWSPVNLKQVRSSGIESQVSFDYKQDAFFTKVDFNYAYAKSINQEIADPTKQAALNKQLLYTPLHEGSINIKTGYKGWIATINHAYTGLQYSDRENLERFALPAYHVMNLFLNKNFQTKKLGWNLQAALNNVFDTDYENRRGYPMYGRNYSISLEITFNNKL
jgi:vitamin B12 transporter